MTLPETRAEAAALDRRDPLAPLRRRFKVPKGIVYLDGNSLGALPRSAAGRIARTVEREWGDGLIRSWNAAGWIDLPARLGARIARLIGAGPDEVAVADSTSVNLFKLLAGALRLRPRRRVILTEAGNFPTDLYIAEGVSSLFPGTEVRVADDIASAVDDAVAVVSLTHVDYRTGRRHDMAGITRRAQRAGALMLWDLAHSAGAMPIDLAGAKVDLAVGCGYKYLNGGPGAPAFLYVARRHQQSFRQPLSGWMGHARPFDFDPRYEPAPGIRRQLAGTPAVIAMAGLEAGLSTFDGVDLAALRNKSLELGDLFVALVERRLPKAGFDLASPRARTQRGSQVSFRHPKGYDIIQALIARSVIGDFRAPDILRFGFAPLYVRYVDIWDAVEALSRVMTRRDYDNPRFAARGAAT